MRVALLRSSAPSAPWVHITAPRTPPSNQQIAAETDPQQRHVGRQLANECREIGAVARSEEKIRRTARMPRGVLGHRHAAQNARCEFRRNLVHARGIVLRRSRRRSRRKAVLQVLRYRADVAGAHGQHQVAVAQHAAQRFAGFSTRSTKTGSMSPRVRTARQMARPSAPAIGASPAA